MSAVDLTPIPEALRREALKEYSDKVVTFEQDELAIAHRWNRRAFLGLAGMGGLVGWLGYSNAQMASELRRVAQERIVNTVVVDRVTGASYAIREVVGPPMDVEEAMIRHMAWIYVRAREGYSLSQDADNFNIVTWMSTVDEQGRFKRWWEQATDGPRRAIGRTGYSTVVTREDPIIRRPGEGMPFDRVEYRARRTVVRAGVSENAVTDYRITIFFGWDKSAMRGDGILINPYGFVVTGYHRSLETA